jgi:hypothetical protein
LYFFFLKKKEEVQLKKYNIFLFFHYRTNVTPALAYGASVARRFVPKQSHVLWEFLVKRGLPRRHTCPGGRCQGRARAAARNDYTELSIVSSTLTI